MDANKVELNRRRTRLLLGVAGGVVAIPLFVVLGVLAFVAGLGLPGVLVALLLAGAVGAGSVLAARASAPGAALAATGARPASGDDEPRLHNLVEGLCVGMGLPKPEIWILDDPAPNALAVGRDPDTAAVVVTRGLLDGMTRVELEAVLAHELSRIRTGDIDPGSLAVTFLAGGASGGGGRTEPSPSPEGAPTAAAGPAAVAAMPVRLAAPVTRALLPLLGPERGESLTDRAAVQVTRYPPALVSALEKLQDDPAEVVAAPALAHLWIEPPTTPVPPAVARLFDAPPPIDERIATLLEL